MKYQSGNILTTLVLWLNLILSTHLLAKDPVSGNFTNELLTLSIMTGKSAPESHIKMNGQRFPIIIQQNDGNNFAGFYQFQGENFPLSGKVEGQQLSLMIDGVNLYLQRQNQISDENNALLQSDVKKAAANDKAINSAPLRINQNEVGDEFLGFKFIPPSDWPAQKVPGGFLLKSSNHKGFILVVTHQYSSLPAIRVALTEGWSEPASGTQFTLNGPIDDFTEQGLAAQFNGMIEWNPARAKIITLLSPFSDGVTVLAAIESDNYSSEFAGLAEKIAKSLKFARPAVSPEAREWQEKLKGSRLTYIESYSSNSGGGYNLQEVYSLCKNGNFNYQGNGAVSIDVTGASGSSVGNNSAQGRWKVITAAGQPALHLDFNDGHIKEFTITNPGNKLHLNGTRYFLTYNPDCP